jgi:4-hydroxy-3-methylbut-2-enyl diphosphate reductase
MSAYRFILLIPRGFCAGVDRAIGIVERALELFGAPIYVRHEVVHNRFVVDNLRQPRCNLRRRTGRDSRRRDGDFQRPRRLTQTVREQAKQRGAD